MSGFAGSTFDPEARRTPVLWPARRAIAQSIAAARAAVGAVGRRALITAAASDLSRAAAASRSPGRGRASTPRVIAAVPNRSRTASSAASTGAVWRAVERQGELHARPRPRRSRPRSPTSVSPRASISGAAAASRPRTASRIAGVCVRRLRERRRAGRAGEVVEAQPQHDRAADPARPAHPARDAVDEPDQRSRRSPPASGAAGPSARCAPIERRRGRSRRGAGRGCARARGGGARRRGRASRRSAPSSSARDLADRANPARVQPRRGLRADAPEPLDGERVEERELAVRLDDEQPVGLRDAARDLREELRARDPDRDRQADALEHVAAEPRGDLGRRPGDPLHPAHVEERLVDREPLDERASVVEDARTPPCSPRRTRGSGAGRRSLGAEPPRLRAAHRRADAVRLRLVARGQHDAAADDHRPAAQPRVVALLDRREERVEVGVEDLRAAHRTHVRIPRPARRRPRGRTPSTAQTRWRCVSLNPLGYFSP